MSDDYRHAKSLRCQFERTWRRAEKPLNRSRLHRQIALCNAHVNKDKSDYYSKLISDNSHDSQILLHELHKTLNRVSDATLPSHESEKSLADQFASFFSNKIKKIRDNFAPSGTKYNVHPPSDPPKIIVFIQVYAEAFDKTLKHHQPNHVYWIHCLYSLSRNAFIYCCHHLQSWLTAIASTIPWRCWIDYMLRWKAFLKRCKQAKVGANRTHKVNHSNVWGYQKKINSQSNFLFM